MNMNKTMKVAKGVFAIAAMLLAGSAWADYNNFSSSAMSSLSGNCSVTTGSAPVMTADKGSTFTYYDGTAGGTDGNNCQPNDRAWMVGAKIEWPNGAYKTKAKFEGARLASAVTGVGDGGNGTFDVGSGSGVRAKVENATALTGNVTESYWWSWITAAEAYDAQLNNGGMFTKALTMGASNVGFYKGVNSRTFTIKINVADLELTDDQGIVWFPAVATNAAGKVYGDLNVALKAGGTIGSVADATITENITLEDGIVYYRNGKNITDYKKLTLNGGTYDFNPKTAGWTLGEGRVVEQQGNLYVVKACSHMWSYETTDGGATFKATCSKECSYTPQTVTIKIDQTSKTYDGTEITASLEYNKGESEFTTQTGATVGEIKWTGDKKSAGEQKVSVTITAGGTPYTISTTLKIEPANMSTTTVTMKNATMIFADKELTNAVDTVTAPGISTSDWEIVDKTALYQSGSGYSNCTYTVTLRGKGNYTGTQTATWTIVAPTRALGDMGRGDFTVGSKIYNDNYGECDQATRTLAVSDTKSIIFVNGVWYVGMTVDLPVTTKLLSPSTSVLTDDEHLRVKVSSTGKTYTGTQIYNKQVDVLLDGEHDSYEWDIGEFQYYTKLRWFTPVTPEMVEQAKIDGKEYLTFTMTVGGLTFKPYGGATWEGFTYKDFTIKAPVDGFVFKVGRNEYNTADIGNVTFDASKIQLIADSVVTNASPIDYTTEKDIFTEESNYDVFETKVSDTCWVYSCEKQIVTITIPNVDHQAGKVVKVGETEKQPTDEAKTKYNVRYGDTVTIIYTAEDGYVPPTAEREMKNVKNGDVLADLPVFTWPKVTVQAEAVDHAAAEIYTNDVRVGASPCEVISNEMVTVVYTADEGYFFYDEQGNEYSTSNKLAAVKADANPTTVSDPRALPVVAAVAKISDEFYPTLGRALAAAKEDETVKLLCGCSNETSYAVANAITLDENGFEATNVCIAATGKVAINGTSGSANVLRMARPTLFGTLANGAKVTTDKTKTYVFIEALDAFYEESAEVVATTYSEEYGEYLESYAKFADGFKAVATNGTIYAISASITNAGFMIDRSMTIDLKTASLSTSLFGTTLTVTNCGYKKIGIYVSSRAENVTFHEGQYALMPKSDCGMTTFVASDSPNLVLDALYLAGDFLATNEKLGGKMVYVLAASSGSVTITNNTILAGGAKILRKNPGYVLYASCYGSSKGTTVTMSPDSAANGPVLVNAQNATAPLTLNLGKIGSATVDGKIEVNAYNKYTTITKPHGTDSRQYLTDEQPELSWQQQVLDPTLDRLVFGRALIVGGGYYSRLNDAVKAAEDGDTIQMCANEESRTDDLCTVTISKKLILDLNGHCLDRFYFQATYVGDLTVIGTNDNSRIVGIMDFEGATRLSMLGGEHEGSIWCFGDASVALTNVTMRYNEEACAVLEIGTQRLGLSPDRVKCDVVNCRLTGYSAAYISGGTLTISNSVLTAWGTEKTDITRGTIITCGTGDALVIDQEPGCTISVNLEAGTKLQHQLDIGCEQLGWYTNAVGTVTANVSKRDGVDVLAVDGYYWDGDVGDILVMTKDPVPPSPSAPTPKMITKNTLNLAPAFKTTGLNPDGTVNVGGEEVMVRPEDLTITVGATADTVSFTSIPDFTYELLATDTLGGTYTVVDRVRATDTETVLTAAKTGAAARFYTVRLVP